MKTRFITLLSVPCLLFALACSDSTSSRPELRGSSQLIIVPTGTLDQNILQILALFPNGLETAATVRWGNVKSKFAAGLTDPAQMVVAKQMVFDLSSWVNQKAPNMDTPPNGETRVSTASRAVLYMLMYVYGGPGGTVPPYSPAADAIVGLVTPTAPATIVTPSGHAGVSLDAGSVAENTVIVVSQNLTPYPDNCTGPLQTLVCQYPSFYNFDQFPHVKLLKAAKFSVCHVNGGTARRPLADHDRFRLAHAKPANPADYTPGSTIRDQNGESIEILPLISQTFVTCPPQTIIYARANADDGVMSKFAHKIQDILSPKTAFAIDQGGGGVSFFFSPFNDVDPDGRPDRAVQGLSAVPACGTDCSINPGSHLTVSFSVANIGTASTGDGAPGLIQLVQPAIEGPPTVIPLGVFQVAQIIPGSSVPTTQDVVVPTTVPAGNYTLRATVGIGFFNEIPADLVNNTGTVPLTVTVDLNRLFSGATTALAIAYHGNGLSPMREGQVTLSALASDEFLNAETFASRIAIDRRSLLSDNVTLRDAFRDLQAARATLDYASTQWQQNQPTSPGHGFLLTYAGFAEVIAAENWCSGTPTSTLSQSGTVVYGAQQSTSDLLAAAVSKFDQALAIANALGELGNSLAITARIGRARALLDLNDFTNAAATAGAVPTDFSTNLGPSPTENNGIFEFQNVEHRWTVSDNEGGNGLPFRSDGDSRIHFESIGAGFDFVTPVFAQLKYPNAGAGTEIANGVEARLIEAEAFLRNGDLAAFTASINGVRVFYGLSPLIVPGNAAAARQTLFKERAYSLWLTSHRLGDLRRLVSQYGLPANTVFPTGEYPKGGVYGSDVNFPIPIDPVFNPTGMVCLDRNP